MGKGLQRGVDVRGKEKYFAALLVAVMWFSITVPHRKLSCSERLVTTQVTWASAALPTTGAHNCPLKTEPEMSPTDPQFVTSETGSSALCYRVMTHGEGKRDFVCVPCQMQSLGYESPNCPRAKHSSGTLYLCLNEFFLQCVTAGANGLVWSSKVCGVFTRKLAKRQVCISHRQRQELNVSFTVGRTGDVGRRQQAPHRHSYHTIF